MPVNIKTRSVECLDITELEFGKYYKRVDNDRWLYFKPDEYSANFKKHYNSETNETLICVDLINGNIAIVRIDHSENLEFIEVQYYELDLVKRVFK